MHSVDIYANEDKRCTTGTFTEYLNKAEAGDDKAQLSLGLIFAKCPNQYSLDKAWYWYKKSAEQNNLNAIAIISEYYYEGRGVAKNDKEAFKWAKKGALLGDSYAQNNLASMYMQGVGVAINESEAIKWAKIASEQGDANAHAKLAFFYATSKSIKIDLLKAYMHIIISEKKGIVFNKKMKREIEKELTKDQIITAIELANQCEVKRFKNC